mmetsp:Transcript_3838/g.5723  ORF Transcript_3838/g.5723 Transcript_3838/m.5723 type:complete len:244 (-) Transcript_3838:67-798(-)
MIFNHVGTVFRNLVPVHNVKPSRYIFWSAVLVLQVVGVFPHIQSKNWEHNLVGNSLHQRIVLVRSSNQLELVSGLIDTDPDPSGSKESSGSSACRELGLHLVQRSERLVDEFLELCGWLCLFGLTGRSHFGPEERVVVVSSAVVADSRSGFERVGHQVEDWYFVLSFRCLVQVSNVGSMMLVVVDFHRRGIDARFEAIERIGKVRNSVAVGNGWSSCNSGCESSSLLKKFTSAVARVGRPSIG